MDTAAWIDRWTDDTSQLPLVAQDVLTTIYTRSDEQDGDLVLRGPRALEQRRGWRQGVIGAVLDIAQRHGAIEAYSYLNEADQIRYKPRAT